MVNVAPPWILSSPTKIARIYHVVKPFLHDMHFTFRQKKNLELLALAQEFSSKPRIVSGVDHYRQLNQAIADDLSRISGRRILLTTGVSVDQTGEGKQIGYDPFSIRNKLSDELIRIFGKLDGKGIKGLEDIVILPVAPFITPYTISYPFASHLYGDIVAKINQARQGRMLMGTPIKDLDEVEPKPGLWQFSPMIYDIDIAKASLGPLEEGYEKEIKDSIIFNRHITAMAFANIIDALGIKGGIDLYSASTSHAYRIVELASRYSGRWHITGDWDVLANIAVPHDRELNKTALARLQDRIYNSLRKDDENRIRAGDLL